jgi:hypothetical protein
VSLVPVAEIANVAVLPLITVCGIGCTEIAGGNVWTNKVDVEVTLPKAFDTVTATVLPFCDGVVTNDNVGEFDPIELPASVQKYDRPLLPRRAGALWEGPVPFGRNRESRNREAEGRRNWSEAVPWKMRGRKRIPTKTQRQSGESR